MTRRGFVGISAIMIVVLGGTAALLARSRPLADRDFRWTRDGVELTGTLYLPKGGGPFPVAVIVPGSGCMPLSHRFYRAHEQELPARGIAVFAYDKRGCGRSTGTWQDVDLDGLADDLLAGLPHLLGDPALDSTGSGLWGLSQGGWVALVAAQKSPMVKYVVLLSGPPMTPAEQGDEVVALGMGAAGQSEAAIAEAVALNRRLTEVYRSGVGWHSADSALSADSSKSWFAASGITLIPRESPYWRWLRRILDYDPLPALHDLKIPILGVYGEKDLLVPGPRSKRIIDSLAPEALGPRAAFVVPGAGHQLRPGANSSWSSGYWNGLTDWMRQYGFLH